MTTSVENAELPQRKMWTRSEMLKLAEVFPDQRFELIEGDLINKMGQNPPHAYVIARLNEILSKAFPGMVRIQSAVTLPEPEGIRSEPEPDVVLLHRNSSEFYHRHPGPSDIALLIEVSDSTLVLDREIKQRLYARSGIHVYWIIDLQQRRVLLFHNPAGDVYKSVQIFEASESVRLPDNSSLVVHELFV